MQLLMHSRVSLSMHLIFLLVWISLQWPMSKHKPTAPGPRIFWDFCLKMCLFLTTTAQFSAKSQLASTVRLYQRQVFDALHCISHPGARVTQKFIATRFVWPNMNKDIRAWARNCLHCQRSKISRYNRSPIGTFRMPDTPFSHLHLGLVGPLPISRGCTYLLTCVDHFSCWLEAIPITNAKAETVVHAFIDQWVTRFGAPAIITTDHGQQFESSLFSLMLNFLGCSHV